MTTLEKALKIRGISYYQLCRLLGKDPVANTGYLKKQVKGEVLVDYHELTRMVRLISLYSKKKLKVTDLNIIPIRVQVK